MGPSIQMYCFATTATLCESWFFQLNKTQHKSAFFVETMLLFFKNLQMLHPELIGNSVAISVCNKASIKINT